MARTPGSSSEKTKKRILEAGEDQFLLKGYAATSLQDIADAANVTKGLIHHYYGSKKNLWNTIKVQRFNNYYHNQAALITDAKPTVALFRKSFELYFNFLKNNPKMLKMLWWSQVERQHSGDDQSLFKEFLSINEGAISMIKALQQEGKVRKDVEANDIFAMFISCVRHWFVYREEYSFHKQDNVDELDEKYLQGVLNIYFDGIVTK